MRKKYKDDFVKNVDALRNHFMFEYRPKFNQIFIYKEGDGWCLISNNKKHYLYFVYQGWEYNIYSSQLTNSS